MGYIEASGLLLTDSGFENFLDFYFLIDFFGAEIGADARHEVLKTVNFSRK